MAGPVVIRDGLLFGFLCSEIAHVRHIFISNRGYVGIHSSGFRDFLLKPELLRAIVDSGFEHPSEGKILSFVFMLNCSITTVVSCQ